MTSCGCLLKLNFWQCLSNLANLNFTNFQSHCCQKLFVFLVKHCFKTEELGYMFTLYERGLCEMSVFWLCCSTCFSISDTTTQAKADAKDFWVNMPNLISHLKKVAEQKPQATYYNVDMLKYQVSAVFWRSNRTYRQRKKRQKKWILYRSFKLCLNLSS